MYDHEQAFETMAVFDPEDKEERKLPGRDLAVILGMSVAISCGIPLLLHFWAI